MTSGDIEERAVLCTAKGSGHQTPTQPSAELIVVLDTELILVLATHHEEREEPHWVAGQGNC